MKRLLNFFATVLFFSFTFWNSSLLVAQQYCATEDIIAAHPEIHQEILQKEATVLRKIEDLHQNNPQIISLAPCPPPPEEEFVIPVVVHVLHDNEAIGSGTNLSYEQIQSQIDALNRDYGLVTDDKGVCLNTYIRFCLAETPYPDDGSVSWSVPGQAGVMRYDVSADPTVLTHQANSTYGQKLLDITHSNNEFPFSKYLNIWIVDDINGGVISGYSSTPYAGWVLDGLVIGHRSFGDNSNPAYCQCFDLVNTQIEGRTAIHEAGHYLGLYHPFHDGENAGLNGSTCLTEGDRVCDTPPCKGPTSIGEYCSSGVSNTGDETIDYAALEDVPYLEKVSTYDAYDHVENFMYYNFGGCKKTFTPGQKERMRAVLSSLRSNLVYIQNLSDVGVAKAGGCVDPQLAADIYVGPTCVNQSLTFTTNSGPGISATSWSWDFDGDGTEDCNSASCNYTYTTTGLQTVKLTVSDGTSSLSNSIDLYIDACLPLEKPENGTWYFGNYATLDFTSGTMVGTSEMFDNGSLNTKECVSTISDESGNVLFYSNGYNLWDGSHNQIATNIGGAFNHVVQLISVPDPKDNGDYWIFVPEANFGPTERVRYTKVNTSGGTVTVLEEAIEMPLPSGSNVRQEAVNAIPHCNGKDYWIITPGYNSAGDHEFYVYLLSDQGLSNKTITSNLPDVYPTGLNLTTYPFGGNGWNGMAVNASPDRQLITLSCPIGTYLYDFNAATGSISNGSKIDNNYSYSSSFSPNSQYLYLGNIDVIKQYKLTDGSTVDHAFPGFGLFHLQQGPNNKIIAYGQDEQGYIVKINQPNNSAPLPTTHLPFTPGTYGTSGFPNFIDGIKPTVISDPVFNVNYNTSTCGDVEFVLDECYSNYSISWDFGDGTPVISGLGTDVVSGANNSGTFLVPTHTYASEGSYNVTMNVSIGSDAFPAVTKNITVINENTTLGITGNTEVCLKNLQGYSVNLSDDFDYSWSVDGGTFSTGLTTASGTNVEVIWDLLPGTLTVELLSPNTNCPNPIASITVNEFPNSETGVITSSKSTFCDNDIAFTFDATPLGGYWEGDGIASDGTFDPSITYVGTRTISYYYTDGNGCTNNVTVDVTVNPSPTVDFDNSFICYYDGEQTLLGSPSGGSWSGKGIVDSYLGTFIPVLAGLGDHDITYSFTNQYGCSNTTTKTLSVKGTILSFAGDQFCYSDVNSDLTATPTGGVWSGTGIVNGATGEFDPSLAGAGDHSITYSLTDGFGCNNNVNNVVEVRSAEITSYQDAFCLSADPVQFTATETGGVWSGNGINSTGVFDPAIAGVGIHSISYKVAKSDGTFCEDIKTVEVLIPKITSEINFVCSDAGIKTLTAIPSSGVWSGTGITDPNAGTFDPAGLPDGSYTITYTYNLYGCTGSLETEITVNSSPTFSASVENLCATDGPKQIEYFPNSPEGSWVTTPYLTADGIIDPSSTSPGNYNLSYLYIDGSCALSTTYPVYISPECVEITSDPSPFCSDDELYQLSAIPSGGIWSGSGVSSTGEFNPSIGGGVHTVYYTYTDVNSVDITESIDILVNDIPGITTNVVYDNGTSNGSISVTVSGVGPFTYLWSNGETTSSISNLSPGDYTLVVTDQGTGCQNSRTITIYEINAGIDRTCPGKIGPTNVSSDLSYVWSLANGNEFDVNTSFWSNVNSTVANPFANPYDPDGNPTVYRLSVYDQNGNLLGTDDVSVEIDYDYDSATFFDPSSLGLFSGKPTKIRSLLTIESDVTVLIKDKVIQFGPYNDDWYTSDHDVPAHGVWVQERGKMILDNSYLTSVNGCNIQWRGIQVSGNSEPPCLDPVRCRGGGGIIDRPGGGGGGLESATPGGNDDLSVAFKKDNTGSFVTVERGTLVRDRLIFPILFTSGFGDKAKDHGQVITKNFTVIENAYRGIQSYRDPARLGSSKKYGGGIIQATNTTFRNNGTGVYFGPSYYKHTNSKVEECSFINSRPLNYFENVGPNFDYAGTMIRISDADYMVIADNNFRVVESVHNFATDKRGTGIESFNAIYSVVQHRDDPVGSTAISGNGNRFENLYKGIDAYGTSIVKSIKVRSNTFDGCTMGVTSNGTAFDEISRNKFYVPEGTQPEPAYAVFMKGSKEYLVAENIVESGGNANSWTHGIVGRNAQSGAVEMYKNTFNGVFEAATQAEGTNSILTINCNDYKDANKADMKLYDDVGGGMGDCNNDEVMNNEFHETTCFSTDAQINNQTGKNFSYSSYDLNRPTCGVNFTVADVVSCGASPPEGVCPLKIGENQSRVTNGNLTEQLIRMEGQDSRIEWFQRINQMIRELILQGRVNQAIDLLYYRDDRESKQMLATTYAYYGYYEDARAKVNEMSTGTTDDQYTVDFLYALIDAHEVHNGNLGELTASELMALKGNYNTETPSRVNTEAILFELGLESYRRIPMNDYGTMAMKKKPEEEDAPNVKEESIETTRELLSLEIVPNPFNHTAKIISSMPGELVVMDNLGRKVLQKPIEQSIEINASDLKQSGMYFVVIRGKGGKTVRKKLIFER